MKVQTWRFTGRQSGMTLIEVISSLAVLALVVIGALALFGSATTSQRSVQMTQDLTALRSSIRTLYPNGIYGVAAADLRAIIISAGRVPTTMATATPAINHPMGGTVTINVGAATNNFVIVINNIPQAECVAIATNTTGYTTVQFNGAAAQAVPITAATATGGTGCTAGNNTMTFTSV